MRFLFLPAALAAVATGLTFEPITVRASDWLTFRGPGRTAVAPDTDLLKAWPDDGPPLVWEAAGAGRG